MISVVPVSALSGRSSTNLMGTTSERAMYMRSFVNSNRLVRCYDLEWHFTPGE